MASTAISDTNLRRVVIASLIGATIEWYDFFLYGTVAGHRLQQAVLPDARPVDLDRCWPTPPSPSASSRGRWAA